MSFEDADTKLRREQLKDLLKDAKSTEDVELIKHLEGLLADLQPAQQAPALHNQLNKNMARITALTNQKEKARLIKLDIQQSVDRQLVFLANVDKSVVEMDYEIEELGKQAKLLAVQMGISGTAGTNPQQVQNAESPPLGSEDAVQKALATIRGACSLEQLTKMWTQQEEEQLQQRQAQQKMQQAAGVSQASAVPSHRGPQGSAAAAVQKRKGVKDLPTVSMEQKAAAGKAATGSAREELLRLARAKGENDIGEDLEEDAAMRIRVEEEVMQQECP